jgi:hypothetical protein
VRLQRQRVVGEGGNSRLVTWRLEWKCLQPEMGVEEVEEMDR